MSFTILRACPTSLTSCTLKIFAPQDAETTIEAEECYPFSITRGSVNPIKAKAMKAKAMKAKAMKAKAIKAAKIAKRNKRQDNKKKYDLKFHDHCIECSNPQSSCICFDTGCSNCYGGHNYYTQHAIWCASDDDYYDPYEITIHAAGTYLGG